MFVMTLCCSASPLARSVASQGVISLSFLPFPPIAFGYWLIFCTYLALSVFPFDEPASMLCISPSILILPKLWISEPNNSAIFCIHAYRCVNLCLVQPSRAWITCTQPTTRNGFILFEGGLGNHVNILLHGHQNHMPWSHNQPRMLPFGANAM